MYLSHLVTCYLRSVTTAQLREESSVTTLAEEMECTHTEILAIEMEGSIAMEGQSLGR